MLFSEENDRIIRLAFEKYYEEFFKNYPSKEAMESVTFSEKFERKMERLIRRQKKPYYFMINTVAKRVAMIILSIIISLTVVTFSVEAIREPVVKFIVETFEKFSSIVFENGETEEFAFVKAEPKYIPDGFVVLETIKHEAIYEITYQNVNDSYIFYSQKINHGQSFDLNTENANYHKKIYIGENQGYINKNKKRISVILGNKQYVFYISVPDTISESELIKMVESLKID